MRLRIVVKTIDPDNLIIDQKTMKTKEEEPTPHHRHLDPPVNTIIDHHHRTNNNKEMGVIWHLMKGSIQECQKLIITKDHVMHLSQVLVHDIQLNMNHTTVTHQLQMVQDFTEWIVIAK